MVPLNRLESYTEIAVKLNVPVWTTIYNVKWIKSFGNLYRPGLAVCIGVENEMPVFHVIQNIVVRDECVLFITTAMKTLYLEEHVHAFKVMHTTDAPIVLEFKDLLHHKCFDILMSCGLDSDLFYNPFFFHVMLFVMMRIIFD